MAAPITGPLLSLMPDTIIVTTLSTQDKFGEQIDSTPVLNLACRISGGHRKVRDSNGREVVSSVTVTVGSVNNLTVDDHKYDLVGKPPPNTNLRAINVRQISDENGPHHEVVSFP